MEVPQRPAPPLRVFSPELATLERAAADLALRSELVDEARVEAQLEALEPLPGEGQAAFEERLALERERLLSDEVLLQYRLANWYASVVYPHGFPVVSLVEQPERQLVGMLPPDAKAQELRFVVDNWEPKRPKPHFAPPELLSWHIPHAGP